MVIPSGHRLGAIKASESLKTPNWDEDIQEAIKDQLAVFATHKQSCGKTGEVVEVPGPDPKPLRQYRYPSEAESGIEETINNLVSQGVLIKTQSPCNSPIWPVLKADGKTWRLTVDYRGVNKVTPRMAPIVAKFPEIMAQIAEGARWFSVIDISNAFFSIPIAPFAWHKFAFTFKDQQYTFTRLPQGFHNSPTICHRIIRKVLKDLPSAKHIMSYVDDILIATEDRKSHLKVLEEVLAALRKAGFLINPEKAQLVKKEVNYLGVQLGQAGRKPDQARVELISKLPAPTNVHSLRTFLGLVGFSRDFIEEFGKNARPLHKLLNKRQEREWGEEQKQAFQYLRTALMKAPALAYPNPDKEYHLSLTAGKAAIGAVLLQEQGTS